MAPALASDPVSQADTPMTDTNDDTVPFVPVDSVDAQMTVCGIVPMSLSRTDRCMPFSNDSLVSSSY